MSRHIDADELIEFFDGYPDHIEFDVEDIKSIINEQDTVDVRENVRGEWLPHPIKGYREWDICSACGVGCKRREYEDKWVTEYNFNFCPNCGAQMMRGES